MRADVHPVTFRYPGADVGAISVMGSFNHWDPTAHPLIYRDGEWRTTVFLPAGTYPYAFIIGGRIVPDPDSTRTVPGPRGGRYSVLVVPGVPSPAHAA